MIKSYFSRNSFTVRPLAGEKVKGIKKYTGIPKSIIVSADNSEQVINFSLC